MSKFRIYHLKQPLNPFLTILYRPISIPTIIINHIQTIWLLNNSPSFLLFCYFYLLLLILQWKSVIFYNLWILCNLLLPLFISKFNIPIFYSNIYIPYQIFCGLSRLKYLIPCLTPLALQNITNTMKIHLWFEVKH